MNLEETLADLKSQADARRVKHNTKYGAGDNQIGVPMAAIRKLAKKIKSDHDLALELWGTGIIDARMLATLIVKPSKLSAQQVEEMVQSIDFTHLADWMTSYVVKKHKEKESLRKKWMQSDQPFLARAGWSLTNELVIKGAEGLDLGALLSRIEQEMVEADPVIQWTMNFVLVHIGIHFPAHRDRALKIGETLGVFRDFPVSKGCTSPYAPIWINEMVSRQKVK